MPPPFPYSHFVPGVASNFGVSAGNLAHLIDLLGVPATAAAAASILGKRKHYQTKPVGVASRNPKRKSSSQGGGGKRVRTRSQNNRGLKRRFATTTSGRRSVKRARTSKGSRVSSAKRLLLWKSKRKRKRRYRRK